jgi:transcriptional regulator with XRE-family HTH domain
MKNIGDMIVEKRKERGLTQAELGSMLGISGKAVSKWERGLSKPCEEHWERLVALLCLPVESTEVAEEKRVAPKATFLSTVRKEFTRIFATGAMIGVSVCNLAGTISTDSTVVSLGFSVALFCFGTMVKG